MNRFGTVRTFSFSHATPLAQPDAPVTSPKDDPGSKGKDVASPPTANDAGFVSTDYSSRVPNTLGTPSRDLDYRRLVLAKETQMLEVQKLQLQLELAKLQVSSGSVVSGESNPIAARTFDQTKSLRDLCAPAADYIPTTLRQVSPSFTTS